MEHKNYPKYVFLHLALMGALYASAISFIVIIFQYINVLFPDQLYYESLVSAIQQASATLVVVFPLFLLMSWLLGKDFQKYPESKKLPLRKWLIYLTLFAAGVAIIVSLISLVFSFFSGELTIRFLLKILTVFIVTGTAFGYYLRDMKVGAISSSVNKILAWAILIVVLVAIGYGFFLIGSPFYQRQVRFDNERINDLQMIQSEIVNYWSSKYTLPEKLSDVEDSIRGFTAPTDPQTGAAYEYEILGPLSFNLCANFDLPTDDLAKKGVEQFAAQPIKVLVEEGYAPSPSPYEQNWEHSEGHTCFERRIDPELYKRPSSF